MSRLLALALVLTGTLRAADPPVGFQVRVEVRRSTRLDWEFVASGFGKDALKLPADFDARQQRYQLFVPRVYKADRAWPLVVFVSPGDSPVGWRSWQKVCEGQGVLYCEAYGAGNSCPPGKRIRIVLDMFDQVRRDYRIDPEQTYISGFSGGGRIACTVGYSLPELFGGIVPLCGTNPLSGLDYLRHRAKDRLSVAFVTGETDFNRLENEKYMAPFVGEVGVRSRLWVVPKMGHALPSDAVLAEVKKWLDEDLPRRREDVKNRPSLACPPDDALDPSSQASRLLQAAETELKEDARTWRGVTLLQGILQRFPITEAAGKARKLLDGLKEDTRKFKLVDEQGGQEERAFLMAQAQALERFNKPAAAAQAYKLLAEQHPGSAEGRKAMAELRRLMGARAGRPHLGIALEGESTVVEKVLPGGPAEKAGVLPGDRLRTLNDAGLRSAADVQRALETVKPGDKVRLGIDRKGRMLTLTIEVTAPPG